MDKNLLRIGDLSLTLRWPTDRDSTIYTCSVTNRAGKILMKKQVQLHVSIQQVEVDSGAESVLLPYRATKNLPRDAKVEWTDGDGKKVHVYKNGSHHPGEQIHFYRTRTKMDENLLKTGDLSLTLKHPTIGDENIYTCRVFNRDRAILMFKRVKLQVKVQHQIKVDSDVESVLLPCRTTENLPGDVRVEWIKSPDKKAHVYENGSDQPGEQSQIYRTRTKMDEEPLRTGDLSLTLRRPTDEDSEIYTCKVSSRNGDVLMKKQVQLEVKVCQVEVEEGAESVLLPFRTTPDLPGDAELEWRKGNYVTVHVYQNNSDQPEKQSRFYRNRTRMDEDLLQTGDLSLTLRSPTQTDSGEYRCLVYSLKGNLQREKTVLLKVKERQQIHERTPLILV
ncbi:muscle M-line assembly protein unc-89-like [Poecilia latipinna]|uniref:muscle M-line assembly protein unc-89-like n=1 Tax=Poecilia latipinna TaxID=48699 RepID=UPI00072E8E3B|nr:PREDICTED: muscle M-line assembly protein unc-89-like [Poecilia latipinna]